MLKIAIIKLFYRHGGLLLLAAFTCNYPAVACVPVPVGGELEVAVSLAAEERTPAVVHLSGDTFVAVWHQNSSGQDIVALCHDSEGVPSMAPFFVNNVTAGDQTNADVASDGSGGFVVVWQSHDVGSTCDEVGECLIKARRFNSSCMPLAAEFAVSTTTASSRQRPRIARGTDGDYLVVWQSNQGGTEDVFARILNSNGTFGSSDAVVHTATVGAQTAPAVAARLGGDYIVTWEGDTDIKARQVSASGAGTGTEVTVNTTTSGGQTQPSIAANSSGEFAVVWEHDASSSEIFIQAFGSSAAITALGAELIVNSEIISGDQSDPAIRVGSDSRFVVAWVNNMSGANPPPNLILGDPIFINSLTTSELPFATKRSSVGMSHLDASRLVLNLVEGEKSKPSIAVDTNNDYLVAWQGKDTASDAIIGRKVEVVDGPVPIGDELDVAASEDHEEQTPAIAHLSGDTFVTVWHQDSSGQDIAAVCFDSEGATSMPLFFVNDITAGDQTNADVVSDGLGGFVVVWQSHDGGSTCDEMGECLIKARRFNSSCMPHRVEFAVSTSTAASRQRPRIARGTDDDFLVVWQSDEGGTEDVFARILNSDGTFGSSATVVHAATAGVQTTPAVAARLSG